MSLRWYRMPRLVALNSSTPVLEAARAIENNNIGAVVVQDRGRVVGILTDRDLAVRVVGQGLDAATTPIAEVMSTPITSLSSSDSQQDALRVMQQRNIRRIPLVDADRLVGIVTLDDLLLDEAAPLDQVAAVVQAQISERGPAASPRSPAARRRAGRAQATYGRLLGRVRTDAELESSEQAETALEIVLESLVRRLTMGEAEDLIAQLPSLLQPGLRSLPPGPDKSISRQMISTELEEQLDVDSGRAVRIAEAVGAVIADTVSPGQIQDVRGQLPEEMRSILPDPFAGAFPAGAPA